MRPRRGPGLTSALSLFAPATGWAHHGGAGARTSGAGFDRPFLVGLLVGMVVVILLAAWALLAPERQDANDDAAANRRYPLRRPGPGPS